MLVVTEIGPTTRPRVVGVPVGANRGSTTGCGRQREGCSPLELPREPRCTGQALEAEDSDHDVRDKLEDVEVSDVISR